MQNEKLRKISGGNILLDPYAVLEKIGVGQGMRIADLGCGAAGHFVIPAAKLVGDKGTVYAVDILKGVLQAVESRAKLEDVTNLETVWSNLEIHGAAKIKQESLDIVLLVNVLFQTEKHQEILREALRLIKREGKLVILEWKLGEAPLGPPVKMRIKKAEVRRLAQSMRLKELEEFEAGPYHYGVVFEK